MKDKFAIKKNNHIHKLYSKSCDIKDKAVTIVKQITALEEELERVQAEYKARYKEFILAVEKIKDNRNNV